MLEQPPGMKATNPNSYHAKTTNPQQTTSNQTGTPQKYIVYRIGVIIIGSGDGLIIAQTTDAYTSLSTAEAGTNFTVYWGDGGISKVTSYNSNNRTHYYPKTGNYTIRIQGQIEGFRFQGQSIGQRDARKLINITKWGPLKLGNLGGYFYNARNLVNITDTPNLTGTTNFYQMFRGATKFNSTINNTINNWNTNLVTDMREMFYQATNFNQNLSSWNTCGVQDAYHFDYQATSWNENNKPKFLPLRKQPTHNKLLRIKLGHELHEHMSPSIQRRGNTTSQHTGETEASAK